MVRNLKTSGSSIFLVAIALPVVALAQSGQTDPYYGWHGWGPWHMWSWGLWWLFPLLMIAFFAVCAFFMARTPWGHGHWGRDHSSSAAFQILSERFAKGEISKEEFEEKRSILARHP